MAISNFKRLEVYKLSERPADQIWQLVVGWDRLAMDTVGKQLVRAVDSIGANIAEGVGRGSFQDNRRFVRVARGSLNETMHWLRRGFARKLITRQQVAAIRPVIDELAPRLNAYLKPIGPVKSQTRIANNNGQLTTDH